MSRWPTRLAASLAASIALAPASLTAPLDDCLTLPAPDVRLACLDRALSADPRERLAQLESVLPREPGWVLASIASGDSAATGGSSVAYLELKAAAHARLEQRADAAEALERALQIDDGTTRLTWVGSGGGGPRWVASLDAGNGRLERAARALLGAGRNDAARPIVARSLALGGRGWPEDAWANLGGGPIPGLDAARATLSGLPWRETLPDVVVPVYGGQEVRLGDLRGQVVVLSFWATWCPPCVRELPHLDALHRELGERGLIVIAVNYQEPPDVALAFAESLGLRLPVGMWTPDVQREFRLETMPTMVVADRQGRVRARWQGYTEGLETQLSTLANQLLSEAAEQPTEVAQVLRGAGLLQVAWMRQGQLPVTGVAVVPGRGDRGPRLAVTRGRVLDLFDPSGRFELTMPLPQDVERLVASPSGREIFGFRPGGAKVVRVDLDSGSATTLEGGPAAVFDVAPAPAEEGQAGDRVLLAAVDGLWLAASAGTASRLDGVAGASGVVRGGSGSSCAWLALGLDGQLARLDCAFEGRETWPVPPGSWVLAAAGDAALGAGVAPFGAIQPVSGRFLDAGAAGQIAAAASDQLVLLDVATGAERWRSTWAADPPRALAAGDLNGDGRDELVVATRNRLFLLSATGRR